MTDLTQAIAELRRVTPPNSPWEAGDIGGGSSPVDYHIATILNAAASGDLLPVQCCMCGKTDLSIKEDGGPECELHDGRWVCSGPCWDKASLLEGGDLIPRSDADLAVALMVEEAATHVRTAEVPREETGEGAMQRALLNYAADVVSLCAPASALAELQALRDARTALTGDRATDFDNDAVYQFSKLMKDKMAKSRAKGRKGWNDPTQCSPDFLRHLLYEHIYKGDPVDVANLCMMLRHYDEPTTPKPEDDLRLLHTEAADAELATLRAQIAALTPPPDFEEGAAIGYAQAMHDIKRLQAQVERLTGALRFYADFHENPNDGPWGINSQDFGKEARAALTEGAAP